MHVLITGAAGMIGRKLLERLARHRALNGEAISSLTLAMSRRWRGPRALRRASSADSDLAAPGVAEKAVAARPKVIFHLAGVVSAEAELDFEKGYRSNLGRHPRAARGGAACCGGYRPRIVYSSSMAVFGAPFPESIPDDFHLTPPHVLRHRQGDRRTAARRLHPARLLRRHRTAAPGDLRAAGDAQQRRRRGSSPRSSASRSPARKRFLPVADNGAPIPTRARAPRWAS